MSPRLDDEAVFESMRHYDVATAQADRARVSLDDTIRAYLTDRCALASEDKQYTFRDFLRGLYYLTLARVFSPEKYDLAWKAIAILKELGQAKK